MGDGKWKKGKIKSNPKTYKNEEGIRMMRKPTTTWVDGKESSQSTIPSKHEEDDQGEGDDQDAGL